MKFSVIIPLYNKALYVEKALHSVLAQTYKEFEVIVVDDGSTDDSLEKVQKFKSSKVQIISQKNSGVSTARNNGVKLAKNPYICFLDADDWWEPTFLEEMHNLIAEYPDAGIYGANYYYVKNRQNRIMRQGVTDGFERGYIDYCTTYAKQMVMPLTSISVVMPRFVFEEMQGFKPHLKLGEDFDLWIRIALKYKVAFLNKPLAYYNQDIPAKERATRNLHKPGRHMLFNLEYLESIEKTNVGYKTLIDKLRANGLMPYYLTKEYREKAQKELTKVDWSKQPLSVQRAYRTPIFLLRFYRIFMHCGSCVKQTLIKWKNRL